MRLKPGTMIAGGAVALLLLLAGAPRADEPCPGFSWDVSAERALFRGAPTPLTAGKSRDSAPSVTTEKLVQLALVPVGQITFAAAPGRKASSEDAYGGLVTLSVSRTGAYRVSVNQGVWIDVVSRGQLVPAIDYEGSHSCDAPHKVVVFNLSAGRPLTLQFSGAAESVLRVTVTRAPGS